MEYKGLLVTFEGGDGSGKSTHVELLKNYLSNKNIEFFATREPGGTDYSEAVRALTKDIRYSSKSLISELFLFESARADIVEKRVIPALKEGKVVIMDRFYDSTTAYQSYGRGLNKAAVSNMNLIAAHGLIPDITFYMRIAPTHAFKRKGGMEQDDLMENIGLDFHNRVLNGFDEIAKENAERYVTLDTTQNIADVFNQITRAFDKKWSETHKE